MNFNEEGDGEDQRASGPITSAISGPGNNWKGKTMSEDSKQPSDSGSVASRCSAAPNALIREYTTCARCDIVRDYCVCVTLNTVNAGLQLTEICPKCLKEFSTIAEMFAKDNR